MLDPDKYFPRTGPLEGKTTRTKIQDRVQIEILDSGCIVFKVRFDASDSDGLEPVEEEF